MTRETLVPVEEMSPTHMRKLFMWLDALARAPNIDDETFKVAYTIARMSEESDLGAIKLTEIQ